MDETFQEDPTPKELWHKNDTINLVKFITELKPSSYYNENYSNVVYMQVANKLFDLGYSKTYIQCKNKWKELILSYKKYKNSPSGDPPDYFPEIDELLSKYSQNNSVEVKIESVPETGSKNPLWSQYETSFLLKVMRIGNYVFKLKMEDPASIYEEISKYLLKIGPISRSKDEIRQRWKSLKNSYVKYIKGDILHFKYFEAMDALLDWEPNSVAFEEDQFKDEHDIEEEICENPDDFEARTMPTSKRSLNWSLSETGILLDVVQKYDVKRMKRENLGTVFDEASMQLRLQGFKRSAEQCRVKFKHMKVKYFSVYRKVMEGDTRTGHHFFHFDRMKEILHSSPSEASSDQEMNQDMEQYEVEYLEEEPEGFEQIYLKEEPTVSMQKRYGSKKCRTLWSVAETKYLLNILKAKKVKRYCRQPIFEEVAYEMEKAGFDRSARNCMIKWKNLRNQLYTCIRTQQEGKSEICPFYDEICEIVDNSAAFDFSGDQDPADMEDEDDHNEASEHNENAAQDLTPEEHFSKKRNISETEENMIVSDSNDASSSKKFKNIGTDPDSTIDLCKNTCNYKMDDMEHYCLSLATTFKRLPEKTRAKLKIEIQKLLYRAEFEEDL